VWERWNRLAISFLLSINQSAKASSRLRGLVSCTIFLLLAEVDTDTTKDTRLGSILVHLGKVLYQELARILPNEKFTRNVNISLLACEPSIEQVLLTGR